MRKLKTKLTLPVVTRLNKAKELADFPVDYYTPSSMIKFGANPILYKINEINRDYIDTASSVSAVIGKAFHHGMNVYYGGSDEMIPSNEQEAVEYALTSAMSYLEMYNDGFINYTKTVPNKEKAYDKLAFAISSYVKEIPYDREEVVMCEETLQERISVKWGDQLLDLPIPLKGRVDKVVRDKKGRLILVDYKTTSAFSNPDSIDGKKLIAAVVYYLLVYANTGEAPYAMRYEEVKMSANRDGSPQTREYTIVFSEQAPFFDLFFRYYEDMTRGLNGEMVYVPNLQALFDNEVALVSYIHRLDQDEERAKLMKKHKVDNITSLLKKELANTTNMQKLAESVERQFAEAKAIDYESMETQDKIQTKLMEHGMVLKFDSVVNGSTVDVYRYLPSIGLKMSKLKSYTADVEQVLGAAGVRILAPIPGTSYVGFEVPRTDRVFNNAAPKAKGLTVPVGTNAHGEVEYLDVQQAPHVLIAGTTGGGKSVMMRSIIKSIGSQAEFWMADPKGVELSDLPHKMYAEDPEDIRSMLEKLTELMDSRYTEMKKTGKRTWDGKPIVCVIDEFGDFLLSNPSGFTVPNYDSWTTARLRREFMKRNPEYDCSNFSKSTFVNVLTDEDEKRATKYSAMDGEELVTKLAQKARAAGIHLIIATQSPRADVVTGRIKANFTTRIALRTSSEIESRIILDDAGAEKLLGKGDALIRRSQSNDLVRIQGYQD